MVKGLRTVYDDYLSDGMDLMVAGQVALPRLLIEKGIITQQEWDKAVQEVLQEIKDKSHR